MSAGRNALVISDTRMHPYLKRNAFDYESTDYVQKGWQSQLAAALHFRRIKHSHTEVYVEGYDVRGTRHNGQTYVAPQNHGKCRYANRRFPIEAFMQ